VPVEQPAEAVATTDVPLGEDFWALANAAFDEAEAESA